MHRVPSNNNSIRSSSSRPDGKLKRHHSKRHHKSMNLGSALFQIKWKRLDDHNDHGDNANDDHHSRDRRGHHHRYHTTTLEGSIDLLRSAEDPTDFMLHFDSEDGEVLNIPLPAGVDWNVACERQDEEDIDDKNTMLHAQVVRLCYVTPDTHCKVKIRIGLPFDQTNGFSRFKAKQFSETIVMANLQSGIPVAGNSTKNEEVSSNRQQRNYRQPLQVYTTGSVRNREARNLPTTIQKEPQSLDQLVELSLRILQSNSKTP